MTPAWGRLRAAPEPLVLAAKRQVYEAIEVSAESGQGAELGWTSQGDEGSAAVGWSGGLQLRASPSDRPANG